MLNRAQRRAGEDRSGNFVFSLFDFLGKNYHPGSGSVHGFSMSRNDNKGGGVGKKKTEEAGVGNLEEIVPEPVLLSQSQEPVKKFESESRAAKKLRGRES